MTADEQLYCPRCGWTGPTSEAQTEDVGGTEPYGDIHIHRPEWILLCPDCGAGLEEAGLDPEDDLDDDLDDVPDLDPADPDDD